MVREFNPELSCVAKEIGVEYGFYTVLSYSHHSINRNGWRSDIHVNVRCRCGALRISLLKNLKNGASKSCGCLATQRFIDNKPQTHLNSILRQHKNRAIERQLTWTLTDQEAFALFQLPCTYCKGMNSRKHKRIRYDKSKFIEVINLNGIDRVNNENGYEVGNCVPCCHRCNRTKSNGTVEEFAEWIEMIKQNLPGIKQALNINQGVEGVELH